MKKMKGVLGLATVLVILGVFCSGLAEVKAASPSGEFRGTIHWALSADWLDPATCSWAISGFFPLYLFRLNTTSSDVIVSPLWNLTPFRSLNSKTFESGLIVHDSAKQGVYKPSGIGFNSAS